ncbi:valine--tRNA ligase [Caldilinea sp.]|jgi:valyl-tRNA synthetase|uniref:valine--tRNA ligase n=1 Tax=Caldilinea sp. TaxID=2293560 RepID=UPI0021DDE292|nr:valine--tRNA ligase [Caldilinea sp.]GIV70910.1 MAG: valine--tRNA ligase [Caldilinea sp.]
MTEQTMTETTMPKAYDPRQVEEKLYAWWEQSGFFRPEQQIASGLADPRRRPFVIPMPPPNVTGALHLGHAITSSIEDMLIRYHRMLGDPTLWVPGTDHAGIATQNVVERHLEKQGVTRHDLGRERFVDEVWRWKHEYHARITAQQKRMGISCDWTRERFTLDEGLSRAVMEAFVRLYDEGLIYRGNYLVNWCPRCQSALSDLEVEHEEVSGRLYTFRYPLKEGGYLEVSTTRPETILGDTAVAVHPDDPRYAAYVGKTALVPMLQREIPVIADAYVDPEFGTGALKVTPGHDPNDYEIGKRHDLPMINIMNEDGTLNAAAGPYAGLDRFEARKKLWADMKAAGLVVGDKEHVHQVGHCQRCGSVVEPLLSEQWWVKMEPLAKPALAAVANGDIQIVPQRFERVYNHWLENIRDWCISRQLWWGHRIPVWYGPDGVAFAGRTEAEARARAAAHYGREVNLQQDPDVLDTWFSSGLWPFSTLGWPDQTEDLATYYPTTVLETGYDILFFWVARMIMMGLKFTGEAPFSVVYLHGLVRDEQGRKMSKSLGNALDPLDLIDEYGADALRFTLLTGSTPGNDLKLSVSRIEANRNFANKIWNAARFVIIKLQDTELAVDFSDPHSPTYRLPERSLLGLADRWILSRYESVRRDVNRLIESWQLGEAGRQLYEFLWSEYCDWYIEASKVRLADAQSAEAQATRQVLAYVLERTLRLLHPYMPFVTEAIWQNLPGMAGDGRSIMVMRWPEESGQPDLEAEEQFTRLQEVIRGIRNVRTEYDVPAARRIAALFSANEHADLINANLPVITALARLEPAEIVVATELTPPGKAATLVAGGVTVYLPLAGLIDLEAERRRLQAELENIDRQIQRIEAALSNDAFTSKAPAHVVERERSRLAELQERRHQLVERSAELAE